MPFAWACFANVTRARLSIGRVGLIAVAVIVTLALAGCGDDKGTPTPFAGVWQAHARTLEITRTGNANEWISLGLGRFVIALRFHLSRPRGTPHDATATATVTGVRLGETENFGAAHPPPRVGAARRIRLRQGVITETLTGAKYCNASVDWLDAGCGA